jgi:hypothetical protein
MLRLLQRRGAWEEEAHGEEIRAFSKVIIYEKKERNIIYLVFFISSSWDFRDAQLLQDFVEVECRGACSNSLSATTA